MHTSPKKFKFSKINIEISNICNLQCTFCPEVIREKKLMSLDLFKKVIQQVAPLTEQVCLHLMGEPLLHPKFFEIIQACEAEKTQIFLVTNGLLLKEKHFSELIKPVFRQINFSTHSFFNNFPEKNPDEYLNQIFKFTEMAFKENPNLYINYRLWNLTNPLGEVSAENKTILKKITDRFQVDLPTLINVKKTKSIRVLNRLYLHFDTEFIWPNLNLPIIGESGTCYGLSSHFGILADGTVVPCCLDKEGKIPLGNLNDNDLNSILNSETAQSILKNFKKNKLINPLCQRCQYIERFK